MKVLIILGTRPDIIKLAPIWKLLKSDKRFEPVVCNTGQHRQMVDKTLRVFGIKPDFDLKLMKRDQPLLELHLRAVKELTEVMKAVTPDVVLVQGDTTTAMAGAFAAFYLRIPVGHVEAGLRTDDTEAPYPEEANRRTISALATMNFAPTETAAEALKREGCPDSSVVVTGNTVIDALLWIGKGMSEGKRKKYRRKGKKLVLVTTHRRENFGQPLRNICRALLELADRNQDIWILYPVHPNPNVRNVVRDILGKHERIELTDPLPYDEFVAAMSTCRLILTDSGGIQEEAPSLGKPVLVLREQTERPEAVKEGTAFLVGSDGVAIIGHSEKLLSDDSEYQLLSGGRQPFGDGKAAPRIIKALLTLVSSK